MERNWTRRGSGKFAVDVVKTFLVIMNVEIQIGFMIITQMVVIVRLAYKERIKDMIIQNFIATHDTQTGHLSSLK